MTPDHLQALYGLWAQQPALAALQQQYAGLAAPQYAAAAAAAAAQPQQQIVPHRGSASAGELPAGSQRVGDYIGTVQEYEESKGFGFVTSDDLKNLGHRKDAFVLRSQMAGCKLGDLVSFTAVITDRGHLQGWNLVYIQDGVPVNVKKTGKGAGKEKAKRQHPSMVQAGADIGDYKGTVTAIHENGASFIRCEELKEKGYTMDAVLDKEENAGYEFGDVVTFTAYESQTGKLCATNVTFESSSYIGAFAGVVKSWNSVNGYGFISCDELKEQNPEYTDVYIHRKHSGLDEDVNIGDKITFQCYLNLKGQPQAKKVVVVESSAPKPICVARPLDADAQALQDMIRNKRALPTCASFDADKGKGKGKGKKGNKDPDKAYAALPLGIALMMKKAKMQHE